MRSRHMRRYAGPWGERKAETRSNADQRATSWLLARWTATLLQTMGRQQTATMGKPSIQSLEQEIQAGDAWLAICVLWGEVGVTCYNS
jgi:hypothetical protein